MKLIFIFFILMQFANQFVHSQAIWVNHKHTDITEIPLEVIQQAKSSLHIAFSHSSYGSQITGGMTGLIEFANTGGLGLSLPQDIFSWNNGGTNGAIDFRDTVMINDVGYFPQWYNQTLAYLKDTTNSEINVIWWSWGGQVNDKFDNGVLWEEYLLPMSQLEDSFPNVTFIYSTGHLEYNNRVSVNAANDSIKSFCYKNQKFLYDAADIESYGPDGTSYRNNGDGACNYYDIFNNLIGNWAFEYQETHQENEDWYNCSSPYTEPYLANLKAYAAWWMFANMMGWNLPVMGTKETNYLHTRLFPNPANQQLTIKLEEVKGERIKVTILNLNGMVLLDEWVKNELSGSLDYTINTGFLQSGLYILTITDGEFVCGHKLAIIH